MENTKLVELTIKEIALDSLNGNNLSEFSQLDLTEELVLVKEQLKSLKTKNWDFSDQTEIYEIINNDYPDAVEEMKITYTNKCNK